MIVLRQKEFARAIPREAFVRELERRGLAGKINQALPGGGVQKYVSKNFRTVKNPDYTGAIEKGWQKLQNRGKSLPTGDYKDMGIHQKINLKGTLRDSKDIFGTDIVVADLKAGGKRLQPKPKNLGGSAGYRYDHPSINYGGESALKKARSRDWKI